MNVGPKNAAVIVAAGSGTRMSRDIPKQFINVLGKPIILYSLETFNNCDNIDEIVEKDCTRILSVDFKDLDENCKFKNYKGLRLYVDQLKGMFSEGKIYFSTIDVKYKMYEVLKVL